MTVKEKILEELKKEWENSEDYEEEYREGLATCSCYQNSYGGVWK